jgi:hypothetical protein
MTVDECIKLIKCNSIILTSIDGVDKYELGSIVNREYGTLDAKGNKIPKDVLRQKVFNIYVKDKCYIEYGENKPCTNIVGSECCMDLFEGIA